MRLNVIETGHNTSDFFDSLKGENILDDTISELRNHIKKETQTHTKESNQENTEQKTNNRDMKM